MKTIDLFLVFTAPVDPFIVLNTALGLAVMEAIVKPVCVRLMKLAMKFIDGYVGFIPDWLHKTK